MNERLQLMDCHTHILPEMDDGSKDLQESIRMLQSLITQGVRVVWLTPHFYPYRESLESFLLRREKSYSILKFDAEQLEIKILLASETFLSDYLFTVPDISRLCIGRKYILTELPFSTYFSQRTFEQIHRLISTYNTIPIVAHVERYPKLLKDAALLDEFIDMGCLTQINLSSLENGIIKRKQILKCIEKNLVHLVGTDCHDMGKRFPEYMNGILIIEKRLGFEYVEQLMINGSQIMSGREM